MLGTVVVGAGPAGAKVAVRLARAGVEVTLLADPAPSRRPWLETLTSRSASHFPETAELCVAHSSAWGGEELIERPSLLSPWGADCFVGRPAFERGLRDEAASAGALVRDERALRVSGEPGDWTITTTSGGRYRAAIVIDATGRARRIARSVGARHIRVDQLVAYPVILIGPVAHLRTRTIVVAVPDGWWFAGPGPEEAACGIFHTDPDLVRGNPLTTLAKAWTGVRRYLASGIHIDTVRRPFPAGTQHLQPSSGLGWIAVGDAAASFDPLSSNGLHFALTTDDEAADCLINGRALDTYSTWVRSLLETYDAVRRRIYGRETRFPQAPFWTRRHSGFPEDHLSHLAA